MKTTIAFGLLILLWCQTTSMAQNPYPSLTIDNFVNSAFAPAREIEAQANYVLKSSEARINHAKAHNIEIFNDTARVSSYYTKQQINRYNKHLKYVQDTEIQRAKREGRLSKEMLDELFDIKTVQNNGLIMP
jgi:hypothetical protein